MRNKPLYHFRYQALVAVADHGRYSIESGDFLRSALRVTACHNYLCGGVESHGLAHESAGVAISFGGNAAGVDDHHIGIVEGRLGKPRREQARADSLAIGASRSASEVLYVKARHHFQDNKA
jgi:hypothetical protein